MVRQQVLMLPLAPLLLLLVLAMVMLAMLAAARRHLSWSWKRMTMMMQQRVRRNAENIGNVAKAYMMPACSVYVLFVETG
jgi:hypothetical protein